MTIPKAKQKPPQVIELIPNIVYEKTIEIVVGGKTYKRYYPYNYCNLPNCTEPLQVKYVVNKHTGIKSPETAANFVRRKYCCDEHMKTAKYGGRSYDHLSVKPRHKLHVTLSPLDQIIDKFLGIAQHG